MEKNLFKNILYLGIIINVIILIYVSDNLFSDGFNVRQSQTAIMARNIFDDNLNFFPTRLTFFAPLKGDVILEFPIIHLISAILMNFFPESEILYRSVNIFFHIINILLVYKILVNLFSNFTSKLFTLIYSYVPLIFYLAHAFMPETSMITFLLLAIYGYIYFQKRGGELNIFYLIGLVFSPLAKPLAGLIYPAIFFDSMKSNIRDNFKQFFTLVACSGPFFAWMIYGLIVNSDPTSTSENWADWTSVLTKFDVLEYWFSVDFYLTMLKSIMFLNSSPLLLILAILVPICKIKFRFDRFFFIFFLVNISILFIFAGAQNGHPYYQVFFVPIVLVYAAASFEFFFEHISKSRLLKTMFGIGLGIHFFTSIAVFHYGVDDTSRIPNLREFIKVVDSGLFEFEQNDRNQFVLIWTDRLGPGVYDFYLDAPTRLFHAPADVSNSEFLDYQVSLGAKYLVVSDTSYGETIKILESDGEMGFWLAEKAKLVFNSPSLRVYRL